MKLLRELPIFFIVLVLLQGLFGCGKPLIPSNFTVETTGTTKHVITIDPVELEVYLTPYCRTIYSDPEEVVNCVHIETAKLIMAFGNGF